MNANSEYNPTLRNGLGTRNEGGLMTLSELSDLIRTTSWFANIGTYRANGDKIAITNLLAPEIPELWHWLPTSNDEANPINLPSLKEIAEQQGKGAEAKNASLSAYKDALVSLRSVNENDSRLKIGPHNFCHAAKGGALYAARHAAIEIVVGNVAFWCSLMSLYADGYWPCGYTKSRKVIVY